MGVARTLTVTASPPAGEKTMDRERWQATDRSEVQFVFGLAIVNHFEKNIYLKPCTEKQFFTTGFFNECSTNEGGATQHTLLSIVWVVEFECFQCDHMSFWEFSVSVWNI